MEIYLDSNILVAYFFEDDTNDQHARILECLEKIKNSKDIKLVVSSWTITEATQAIHRKIYEKIADKTFGEKEAKFRMNEMVRFIKRIREGKLGDLEIEWRRVQKEISAEDFLDLIDQIAPLGNLTDGLHCVLMKLFGISHILTFNKKDFEIFKESIEGIEAILPDELEEIYEEEMKKAPPKGKEFVRGDEDNEEG